MNHSESPKQLEKQFQNVQETYMDGFEYVGSPENPQDGDLRRLSNGESYEYERYIDGQWKSLSQIPGETKKSAEELLGDIDREELMFDLFGEQIYPPKLENYDFLPERDYGFARLMIPSEIAETLDSYSIKEKQEILRGYFEAEELPEELVLKMEQLTLLQTVAEEVDAEMSDPKTYGMKARQLWEKWSNLVTPGQNFTGEYTDEFSELAKKDLKKFRNSLSAVAGALLNGEAFEDSLGENAFVKMLEQNLKLDFSEVKTREELSAQTAKVAAFLREIRHYDAASRVMEDVLLPHVTEEEAHLRKLEKVMNDIYTAPFDKKESRRRQVVYEQLPDEDQKTAYAVYRLRQKSNEAARKAKDKNLKYWLKQGISEEKVDGMVAEMADAQFETLFAVMLAGRIDESKLSPAEREIWEHYVQVNNPKNDPWVIRDEMFDKIMQEVAINLPLILVSGGAASLARAGVSSLARATLGRIAANVAIRQGEKFVYKELAISGGRLVEEWAAKGLIRKGASKVPGLLVEGLSFEMAHAGLQGEWLLDMPDWGQRVLWTSATLGLFHKSMQLSDKAFAPGAMLNKYVTGKFKNKSVEKVMEHLVLRQHMAAATFLVMEAAQHGVYIGNFDEFWNHFGESLLHSYVASAALTTAGGAVQKGLGRGLDAKAGKAGENEVYRGFQEKVARANQRQTEAKKEAVKLLKAEGALSKAALLVTALRDPLIFRELISSAKEIPLSMKEAADMFKELKNSGKTLDAVTMGLFILKLKDFKKIATPSNIRNAIKSLNLGDAALESLLYARMKAKNLTVAAAFVCLLTPSVAEAGILEPLLKYGFDWSTTGILMKGFTAYMVASILPRMSIKPPASVSITRWIYYIGVRLPVGLISGPAHKINNAVIQRLMKLRNPALDPADPATASSIRKSEIALGVAGLAILLLTYYDVMDFSSNISEEDANRFKEAVEKAKQTDQIEREAVPDLLYPGE